MLNHYNCHYSPDLCNWQTQENSTVQGEDLCCGSQNYLDFNMQSLNQVNPSLMFANMMQYIFQNYCLCCKNASNIYSRKFHKDVKNSNKILRCNKDLNDITFENNTIGGSTMSTSDQFVPNVSMMLNLVSKASDRCEFPQINKEQPETKLHNYSESSDDSSQNRKRDMVNYEALQGHPYEIKDNPDRSNGKGARIYICKYDGCNKCFSKTWNLVYHFRTHSDRKPYRCEVCEKDFAQKANFQRHMAVHNTIPLKDRKIFHCSKCSRTYSNKYNLNAHLKKDHDQ